MSLFGKDFFPTPPALVRKLIACVSDRDSYSNPSATKYVIDPAAGNGAILDALNDKTWHGDKPMLYACEIEPELCAILESKGYPVMARDFLEYTPQLQFDYIIANPPFSLAAKFVIHAWEILTEGGTFVTILPKTILARGDSFAFQACRLIDDHGTITDLGKPFTKAERKTDVECIMVTFTKKKNGEKLEFNVENDFTDKKFEQEFDAAETGIMPAGFIASRLANYNAALGFFADYRKTYNQIAPLIQMFDDHLHRHTERNQNPLLAAAQANGDNKAAFNQFYSLLTEAAWNSILDYPDLQRSMTTRARKMIDEFRKSRNRIDFNEANIRAMFMALVDKTDELLKQCVFDAFDKMTEYHWENRVHVEGWKSNKSWMVNPRVVLPYCVRSSMHSGYLSLNYGETRTELDDIDRALGLVMGLPFEKFRHITQAIDEQTRAVPGASICYSHFFRIRYYIKGTAHLYFKDMAVWRKFNFMAARMRGWLPDHVKPEHLDIRKRKQKPDPKFAGCNNPAYMGERDDRANENLIIVIDPKLGAGRTKPVESIALFQSEDITP